MECTRSLPLASFRTLYFFLWTHRSRYTETMEALEHIAESELTASELSYYIGVMSRIQQMVLAVAG